MNFAHTYLMRSGFWELDGLIEGPDGQVCRQTGQLVVCRRDGLWSIDSLIVISRPTAREIVSRYEVGPFNEKDACAEWKAHLGGPAPIYGLFVIVEDAIMSPWQSSSGDYWGQEIMVWAADDEYRVRGYAFLKRQRVSAWSARMFRRD